MTVADRRESDYLIKARSAQNARTRRIMDYLETVKNPVQRSDLARETGINDMTLYMHLRKLVSEGKIYSVMSEARSIVGRKIWYAKTPEILESWRTTFFKLRPPLDPVKAHKKKPTYNEPNDNWFNSLVAR